MAYLFTLVLLALLFLQTCRCSQGADFSLEPVQIIRHTLPPGLQAVNGSDDDGDCGDISIQSNGLRVCYDPNAIFSPTKSVLVDGTTPTLDFSDDNWAEGYFTVRRNSGTTIELGFELDTNDIITRVEVESLECPDRGIGASSVSLFGMDDPFGVLFPTSDSDTTTLLDMVAPEATSCSSQTHTFCIPMGEQPYRYYYLVFTFSKPDIDWLFLAEVRFLVNSTAPTTTTVLPTTITSVTPAPSATALSTSPRSSALESSTVPTPAPPSGSSGEPIATIPPVRATEKDAVSDAIIASTAAIIGLQIIILLVLVVVVFKYRRRRQKRKQGEAPKTAEAEYENVAVGGSNDPEYEEIDVQERGFQMKENEAYASANMPTEPNVAYALVRN